MLKILVSDKNLLGEVLKGLERKGILFKSNYRLPESSFSNKPESSFSNKKELEKAISRSEKQLDYCPSPIVCVKIINDLVALYLEIKNYNKIFEVLKKVPKKINKNDFHPYELKELILLDFFLSSYGGEGLWN